MTLHPGVGSIEIERLSPAELIETFAFLDREPVLNVYPLAALLRDGLAAARDEFWGARRGGQLAAVLMLGSGSGSVLPIGADAPALDRLAELVQRRAPALPRRFQVIGARDALAPFVRRFAENGLAPRLSRDQIYMALDRADLPGDPALPGLRAARRDDYERLYESGARLRAEELFEDPRLLDPAAYARRVEEECRDGLTFVWCEGDALRFRASLSAISADAAQISGVYTPPEARRRGIATRGVAEVCRRIFPRSRHACLFVNDFNQPALSVYRRLGFKALADWGSAFYDQTR